MTDAAAPALPPQEPAYKDRSGLLKVLGILKIVLGGLIALLAVLMTGLTAALPALAAESAPPPPDNMGALMAMIAFTYGMMAAGFIVLGVGTLRARRWALALNRAFVWLWLAMGILGTVLVPLFLGLMFHRMQGNEADTGFLVVGVGVMTLFCALFYIGLPLLARWLYHLKGLTETVQARDVPRWTDRFSIPHLGWAALLFQSALFSPVMFMGTYPAPWMGRWVDGPLAHGLFAAYILWLVGALVLVLRRSILGWGLSLGGVLLIGTSLCLTLYAEGLSFYADMMRELAPDVSPEQFAEMEAMFNAPAYAFPAALGVLAVAGFLLWLRPQFRRA